MAADDGLTALKGLDDLLGARVDGNGEADSDVAAEYVGEDGLIDGDDFGVHVEEGAAGAARIDGGVGLYEVAERTARHFRLNLPVERADDADGHGGFVAKWFIESPAAAAVAAVASGAKGVPNGHRPGANFSCICIAELGRYERLIGVNLYHCDIRNLVGA